MLWLLFSCDYKTSEKDSSQQKIFLVENTTKVNKEPQVCSFTTKKKKKENKKDKGKGTKKIQRRNL